MLHCAALRRAAPRCAALGQNLAWHMVEAVLGLVTAGLTAAGSSHQSLGFISKGWLRDGIQLKCMQPHGLSLPVC